MSHIPVPLVLAVLLAAATLPAQTITVPGDHPTIQDAIDNVAMGGTILVDPGTYVETLLVDPSDTYGTGVHGQTDFTIEGAGPGVVIQWPDEATRSAAWNPAIMAANGEQGDAILWITGTNGLVLRNLTFDGDDEAPPSSSITSAAVAYSSASGLVEDCTIMGVQDSPTSGGQNGLAILVEGASSSVTVDGCTLQEIQKSFIVAWDDSSCQVQDCQFTGRGLTTSIAQNGVQFSGGGSGSVTGCVFDGFWWVGTPWTSTGVLWFAGGNPTDVTNCTFRDCQTGVYYQASGGPIQGSVTNCDFTRVSEEPTGTGYSAVFVWAGESGSSYLVSNNTFSSHQAEALAVNTGGGTITGNYFNNNGELASWNQAWDEYDGSTGDPPNNWDGNTWSDLASNSGYPGSYDIPGPAGAVDNNPSGGCPDFQESEVSIGVSPSAVVLQDVDGDGHADIVTANSTADSLTVVPNDGNGGFGGMQTTVALSSGDGPVDLASGDLEPGPAMDLAAACNGSDTLRILDGTGGALTPSTTLVLPGLNPRAVAAGDLDGAGAADVAVALEGDLFTGGSGIAVSLGLAPATLLSAPPAGFMPVRDVELCDLDDDGDLDLAATMAGDVFNPSAGDVLLYENDGAGSFTYRASLGASPDPRQLCCEDLDGDGLPDLAVALQGDVLNSDPGGVLIYINQGAAPASWGTGFTSIGPITGGQSPSAVACADLGDDNIAGFFHRPDVVVTNFGTGNMTRFKNFDGTAFAAEQSCSTGLNPSDLAIGELNDDHTLDVVTANTSGQSVTVALAVPRAIARTFGTACTGTGGLSPSISPVGLPTFGNPAFGVKVSDARPWSAALLGVSLGFQDLDLGGGCSFYLDSDFIIFQLFTDAAGEAVFTFAAPPDVPPFSGLNAYFQYAVFDPNGAFGGLLAYSNALRIKFGN